MATKIRLMRLGKIRAPYYRIVVADSRTKRDGRVIETIGKYHPKEDPSLIEVNSERAQYWLSVGAQPTEPVAAILRVTGDWQRFKGEPAPAEGVKTAPPRPDRKAIFEAAAKESLEAGGGPATTPRKSAAKKAAAPAEAAPAAEAPAAEAPATDEAPAAPAAEAPAAEAAETPAEAPTSDAAGTDVVAAAALAEGAPAGGSDGAADTPETPSDS